MVDAPWASKPWGVDIAKAFAQGVTEYNKDPDTADEEAFQRSRGKASGHTALEFSGWDSSEHPRDDKGQFESGTTDLHEFPTAVQASIRDALTKVGAEFSGLVDSIKFKATRIQTGMGSDAFGKYDEYTNTIELDPSAIEPGGSMEQVNKDAVERGFFNDGGKDDPLGFTVAHELGHALETRIDTRVRGVPLSRISDDDDPRPRKWQDAHFDGLHDVSGYARSGTREGWAEAFASYFYPPSSGRPKVSEELVAWAKNQETRTFSEPYTELLTFAEFDPAEHPRGKGGKFAKAAVGDTVEYALQGISGQEKHTGTVVHADENGVAVQGASGEVRQLEHKDVTVLPPKGSALGDTRIPTADELVDADKSELSRWMLGNTIKGDFSSHYAQKGVDLTLPLGTISTGLVHAGDVLEIPTDNTGIPWKVAGPGSQKGTVILTKEGNEEGEEIKLDDLSGWGATHSNASVSAGKESAQFTLPSHVSETDRQLYKIAIAEHLGNVLLEKAKTNPRIGQEIGAPEGMSNGDISRILDIQQATTSDEIRSGVEKAYADYPEELAYMKNDPELQEYFHRADEGNMAMRLRVSNYVGNRLSQAQPNTLDKDLATQFASEFIHTWAETSADTHPGALAIQEMVAKEFGIPMAKHLQSAIDDNRVGIDSTLAQQGETIKTLVRAQYDWTQQELAKAGVKEVTLYRGMEQLPQTTSTGLDDRVSLQPLSSFSVEYNTALSFANKDAEGNALTVMRVPRERVFSTAKTGFGCLNEGEVVVLGGPNLPALTTWAYATQGIGGMVHELPALNLQRTFVGALQKEPSMIGELTGRQQHAEQQVDPQQGAALDADLANSDWTKSTWDLPYNTVKDLRAYLDRQGMTVEAFKTLPVYLRNVERGDFTWLRQL